MVSLDGLDQIANLLGEPFECSYQAPDKDVIRAWTSATARTMPVRTRNRKNASSASDSVPGICQLMRQFFVMAFMSCAHICPQLKKTGNVMGNDPLRFDI